jgi:NitT/TauT family transport system ATP-binding protein
MQLQLDGLNGLSVNFRAADGSSLAALGPVSMKIEAGSFVALLGPSGSGKSTLIRVLAGLQKASSGQAFIDGKAITEPLSSIGIMFQDATLMPWRTVEDNIALPLELGGLNKAERLQHVKGLLPNLGLEEFSKSYPSELSGGMAQRVALGRILVQDPRVLLLDEPFGALDAMTRETLSLDLLRIWSASQQTVVMVTHDIHEAVLMADRVLVLSRRPGRVIADIEVPLDRPRTVEMVYTAPFVQTAKAVRQAIDRA